MNNEKGSRVVIVTGGAQGIGAAIARRFRKANDTIIIADINETKGSETAHEIGAKFIHTNVTQYYDCDRAIELVLKEFGKIDVVIANAGKNDGLSTEKTSPEEWDESINLNLTSVFTTCKLALPHLPNEGRIIAISSVVGVIGQENNSAYSAAKAGIIGYVRSLALELAPRKITVNAICPNAVDTPLLYEWAKKQPHGEEKTLARMKEKIPLRRWLLPEEVAGCAFFLAGEDAAYITGQSIIMSGGYDLG